MRTRTAHDAGASWDRSSPDRRDQHVRFPGGPLVGGLFLAFPSILPASLTLQEEHEGRSRAIDDVRGGRLGSVGLGAFALMVAWSAPHSRPWITLAGGAVAWILVDVTLWGATLGRKEQHSS